MHSTEYFDRNFVITQKFEIFDRTESGKNWKRKPTETKTETITGQQYLNLIQPWAGDRKEYGYTYAGYLPIKIRSISPNGMRKAIWSVIFELKR